MNGCKSGSNGTSNGTACPAAELDLAADFRAYEATQVARVGEAGFHLVVPAHRKRLNTIVVEAGTELLCQLLELRDVPVREAVSLKERNQAQSETILRQATRLREAQEENTRQAARIDELTERVREYGDKLTDAEARFAHMDEAYTEDRAEMAILRARLEASRKVATGLGVCVEAARLAIRKALNPRDSDAAWKTAHTALRNTLAREGFHPQTSHGFFTWSRRFGCSKCVPEWLMLAPTELADEETAPAKAVVAALQREVEPILRPALYEDPEVVTFGADQATGGA